MSRPEHRVKVGAYTASIFAEPVQTSRGLAVLRSVSLQRAYKAKDGTYRYTASLRAEDLPKAILALQKAYEHLVAASSPRGTPRRAGEADSPRP